MSARYEWMEAADCIVAVAVRGQALGEDEVTSEIALVLGDPWASATVLEGSRADLLELLDKLRRAITTTPPRNPEETP